MGSASDSTPAGFVSRMSQISAAVIRRILQWRLVRAALRYAGRRGPGLADAVTYRALFSVFAGVLLGFSVAALWLAGDDAAWDAVVSAVDSAIPGLITTSTGTGIIDPASIRAPVGLSIAGVLSLVGLVGSALGAIGSLRTAMRVIAGTATADIAWYRVILRNVALALIISSTFLAAAALTFAGELIVGRVTEALGVSAGSAPAFWVLRGVSLVVVFTLNAVLIAASVRMLSGIHLSSRSLWGGAALGALALLVLQELSGLFIGGATANPLLASFASLLALLLWLNLSTQVILLTSAFIAVSASEEHDRVAAKHGAQTLTEDALRRAEDDARVATLALRAAQDAVAKERAGHS